jgi:hypothetical protein
MDDEIIDTVPKDVECRKIQRCDDHHVCVVVCERGSVQSKRWAEHALSVQRKLAYTHSLCHAQLPGTHNSAITMADVCKIHVCEDMRKMFIFYVLHDVG